MRKEYDFDKMKGRKNPYAKHLKKQVTIRMGVDIIDYFKNLAEETGVPYQNLINLYLRDCVQSNRKLSFNWSPQGTEHSSSL
ncbi:CopG family antitoxin [Desulfatitalea alkaliphila]|uniref:BrnA antitoxin family protein n=1 Tax=Desulfatitalea alkaliphila TaxID=2929485 RepID=A0AA41UMZ2_9BACT|nr:CopG family antitoxin [Desulfatitalea alkaliphila]MCJ8503176.1 BrnA antitoxin family protein [Desulfatitalea alkaliphila]